MPTPWDFLVGWRLLSPVSVLCHGGIAKWSEQRQLISWPDCELELQRDQMGRQTKIAT